MSGEGSSPDLLRQWPDRSNTPSCCGSRGQGQSSGLPASAQDGPSQKLVAGMEAVTAEGTWSYRGCKTDLAGEEHRQYRGSLLEATVGKVAENYNPLIRSDKSITYLESPSAAMKTRWCFCPRRSPRPCMESIDIHVHLSTSPMGS